MSWVTGDLSMPGISELQNDKTIFILVNNQQIRGTIKIDTLLYCLMKTFPPSVIGLPSKFDQK